MSTVTQQAVRVREVCREKDRSGVGLDFPVDRRKLAGLREFLAVGQLQFDRRSDPATALGEPAGGFPEKQSRFRVEVPSSFFTAERVPTGAPSVCAS